MLFLISVSALVLAAVADGVSTCRFLRGGQVETDPVLVFLLGTNKPSSLRLMATGAAVITVEIAAGLLLSRYLSAGLYVSWVFLGQTAVHGYNTIRNYRLPLFKGK